MIRVIAFTKETKLFSDINKECKKQSEIECTLLSDLLDLFENFVKWHTQLVILDLDIIEGRTIQLVQVLRVINKNCKFLLILSPDKMEECSKALPHGMVAYFTKPISPLNISKFVQSVLK